MVTQQYQRQRTIFGMFNVASAMKEYGEATVNGTVVLFPTGRDSRPLTIGGGHEHSMDEDRIAVYWV
jgi:hypothetical protein